MADEPIYHDKVATTEPICPYCGMIYCDEVEVGEQVLCRLGVNNETEIECDTCGNRFRCKVESLSFTTWMMEDK